LNMKRLIQQENHTDNMFNILGLLSLAHGPQHLLFG
jgi:hypothetical protein